MTVQRLIFCLQQPTSPRPSKIPQRVRDEKSNKSDKSEILNSGKEQNSLSNSRKDKNGKRYLFVFSSHKIYKYICFECYDIIFILEFIINYYLLGLLITCCRSPDVTIGSDDGDDIFGDSPLRTK